MKFIHYLLNCSQLISSNIGLQQSPAVSPKVPYIIASCSMIHESDTRDSCPILSIFRWSTGRRVCVARFVIVWHAWKFRYHMYTSCCFLNKPVTGCKMFRRLSRLAKVSLTISHGTAVAKRGFSVNTALLRKDRMLLDETTVQALRLVKETTRLHGRLSRQHSTAW